MFDRLRVLEGEVAAHERHIAAQKTAIARQYRRTRDAAHTRLGQPDALVTSAGLGALYGLWVTRPRAGTESRDEAKRPARRLPIPGWMVRTGLSVLASYFFSGAGDGAAVEPDS